MTYSSDLCFKGCYFNICLLVVLGGILSKVGVWVVCLDVFFLFPLWSFDMLLRKDVI